MAELDLPRAEQESQANQVNTTMGDVADDILSSFSLSEEDKTEYDVVVEKFEAHFVKKRNVIFEQPKFNQRRQEEGKPVDDFVTSCTVCKYGNLHDEIESSWVY